MFRLIAVAACIAHVQGAATTPAPLPNCRIKCVQTLNPTTNTWSTAQECVSGKDQLKLVNDAYAECKTLAVVNGKALCQCATNEWAEMFGCTYPWIQPWLATVQRDKLKYCGASSGWSGGSSESSSSGSAGSSGSSIGWSHQFGFQSADYPFTWQQKALILTLITLACCLCCGGCAVVYMMNKGSFKAKKTKPRDDFDDMAYQDYEAQQFDQAYPGDGGFPEEPVSDLPPALDPNQQYMPEALQGGQFTGQPLMS